MRLLIAICPVLFDGIQYSTGDKLPTYNAEYVEAWIKNEVAFWQENVTDTKTVAKAKLLTAEPGITGEAYPSAGVEPDLLGKVPSQKARGAQSEPKKRGAKRSD